MAAPKSLVSYSKCPALCLNGRQAVARDAAPDWLSGQVARYRLAAIQTQPEGPDLFAVHAAILFNDASKYVSAFSTYLRANSFRRGVLGI